MSTFGATHSKLIENGYAPCSAIAPAQRGGYRLAEHPAAVLCRPDQDCGLDDFRRRKLVSLIVTTRDKALRAKIGAVIESLGLADGPARTGSDGSEHRPLRFDEYADRFTQTASVEDLPPGADPTVILEGVEKAAPGAPLVSALIRVDGSWTGGTLLEVPRAKLPAIDDVAIERLFRELRTAFRKRVAA